jgi:hypothetical protein
MMKQFKIDVKERHSGLVPESSLILTVPAIYQRSCDLIVGYPGLPNAQKKITLGSVFLFESPNDGLMEIRLLSSYAGNVEILVSTISPNLGVMGGYVEQNQENTKFSEHEIQHIYESLEFVKSELAANKELKEEQYEYLSKKIDEIGNASKRLGKRDWINYVIGVLSSATVSMSLPPEVTKNIFSYFNSSFSWLFESIVKLIG